MYLIGCKQKNLLYYTNSKKQPKQNSNFVPSATVPTAAADSTSTPSADKEDLIQEGMIGLYKAIRDFRKEKEVSFQHFAELCITRQMYTAVEASQRKKHAPLNSYISLYDDSREDGVALADVLSGEEDTNPEHLLIGRENLTQKFSDFAKCLSKMEKKVFDYMLEGLNYKQIAEEMGKTPKAIDNAIQRMRTKYSQM